MLEARFPEVVATQPELLAHHYTAAGCTEQAVTYWQWTGEHTSNCSANLEAVSHLTTGIELLKSLPEMPARTQHALTLHLALGVALLMTKGLGAPEVEQAYTQAYARPGRMAAGFAYFSSFPKTATDFAELAKKKLSIPLLTIGGDKSLGGPLGAQGKLVAADATAIVLKDTGHWIMEERPDETIAALVQFLR